MPTAVVSGDLEKSFSSGSITHPWIFRNSLRKVSAKPGDILQLLSSKEQFLGQGFYSDRSQIAVRMLTDAKEEIHSPFWEERIQDASRYREMVVQSTNAYRLISAEGDLLPGFIVDRYDDHLVMQTLCAGTERLKEKFVGILQDLFKPVCIVERNDVHARELEGLEKIKGVLLGSLRNPLIVQEADVQVRVDLLEGQKTGSYLDQRENRVLAGQYAYGNVMDGFCYQGGFALHLAKKAEKVLAVDSSAAALAVARENAELNGMKNIEFCKGKIYDVLKELKGNSQFDMICLDPPAFAKSSRDVGNAERGYREINRRAMELIRKGGFLATSSCSYHMTEERFLKVLRQAATLAKKTLRIVEKRTQGRDHPILLSMPESYYLKFFIFQVV